jgi:hypothetical protein
MDLYHQYGPLFANCTNESWEPVAFSTLEHRPRRQFSRQFSTLFIKPVVHHRCVFGHKNIPEAIATLILLQSRLSQAPLSVIICGARKGATTH